MAAATHDTGNTRARRALLALLKTARQAHIAAAIESSQAAVSYWANGERRPAPLYRARLERKFGIAAAWWLTPAERAEEQRI